MPLPEFYSSMKGKHASTQSKMAKCSFDLSSLVPDQDFFELLWENGQIVMQGQSNRHKKSTSPDAFPSYAEKAQEKEFGDAVAPKASRYGMIDSAGKHFSVAEPLGQSGMGGQDVDMDPWPNYPIDDYCTEFLSEFSGVNLNSSYTTVPADRISNYSQATRGANVTENGNETRDSAGCSEPNEMINSQLFQLPPQCQSFTPRGRPKESDVRAGIIHRGPTGDLQTSKVKKQDLASSNLIQLHNNNSLANFSHFSRPVGLVKANIQIFDRVKSDEASTNAGRNPMESTLIKPMSDSKSVSGFHEQLSSVAAKAESKSSAWPLEERVSIECSDAICQEDAAESSRNCNKMDTMDNRGSLNHMKYHSLSFRDGVAAVSCEAHKPSEPAVALPSMCSANGTTAASNLVKNRGKRKSQEGEESEYQSEDFEDDLVDIKKHGPGRGTGTKRSRAAEVHNLSERRRRDRINEKMRALQELIPNCNKVDKASVLDEAIEYLKSLQMQVQIMSMGSSLCMPPMILPAGVHATHMGPFGPLAMGMGMGFGMGMLDMTGTPLIPVPPTRGLQYPCPVISGASGLHGIPLSNNLHTCGIPGQTLAMPMPRPPSFIPVTAMSVKMNPLAEVPKAEVCPAHMTDSGPDNSKDQQLETLEPAAETATDNLEVKKGCNKPSSAVDRDNKASDVCGNKAVNSGDVVSSSAMTSID